MKYLSLIMVGSAMLAAPAFAQAPASTTAPAGAAAAAPSAAADVTVGATVNDNTGAPVGTIESVSGGNAVLSTGTAKASIPVASFAKGPNGLIVGITKAELEAKVAQATTPTEIAVGTAVSDPQGGSVGKVEAVSGDLVTVATASSKVQVPKSGFAKGPNGLVIGMTAAQLDAAAKQSAPAGGAAGK
ncbi:hypothetical protein [Sphingomonas sp.]|uniref:hypothetical protein n=1 Tax=Sphingomonas sp. TaxID=28214 RepID=UPI003B3B7355